MVDTRLSFLVIRYTKTPFSVYTSCCARFREQIFLFHWLGFCIYLGCVEIHTHIQVRTFWWHLKNPNDGYMDYQSMTRFQERHYLQTNQIMPLSFFSVLSALLKEFCISYDKHFNTLFTKKKNCNIAHKMWIIISVLNVPNLNETLDEQEWLKISVFFHGMGDEVNYNRKWQDYVYIQCEYKSTKQKIKHLLREENKVKENKIS